MKGFKFALQIYSVAQDAGKDLQDVLYKAAEMGYEGVEMNDLYGHSFVEIGEMLKKAGLSAPFAHVLLSDLEKDPKYWIKGYKSIGCEYIAVPVLFDGFRPGQPGFESAKNSIVKLISLCEENGLGLLYHNHAFEFEKIGDEYMLDVIYSKIPGLCAQLDTCWVKVGGEDPCKYMRKYAQRCPVIHLKDYLSAGGKARLPVTAPLSDTSDVFEYRPLGTGIQDIPAILEEAEKIGLDWIIVEQDAPAANTTAMECAGMSMDYLKSL